MGSYFIFVDSRWNSYGFFTAIRTNCQDAELVLAQILGHVESEAHRVNVACETKEICFRWNLLSIEMRVFFLPNFISGLS